MEVDVATGTPAALVATDTEGVSHGGKTCEGCVISPILFYFLVIKNAVLLEIKKTLVVNVGGFAELIRFLY